MNTLDYILIAALIVAVGFALRRIRLDKKQGKGWQEFCQENMLIIANNPREDSTHGHHQMLNTQIKSG